ncbi:MAG: hypothetical protein HQK59_16650, partial [Deltaproteobacteria bacterium]|nr:hypothetical protein [Deltaproteobacteria bacterium]
MELELKEAKVIAEANAEELRQALNVSETLQLNLENAKKELEKLAEQADQANRAKSEFLANMSHEIRTPLNAIVGFNKLLLDSNLPSRQKSFAEAVSQAVDHLLLIINDILDFSKIESGKTQIDLAGFSPENLFQETIKMFQPLADKKQ